MVHIHYIVYSSSFSKRVNKYRQKYSSKILITCCCRPSWISDVTAEFLGVFRYLVEQYSLSFSNFFFNKKNKLDFLLKQLFNEVMRMMKVSCTVHVDVAKIYRNVIASKIEMAARENINIFFAVKVPPAM